MAKEKQTKFAKESETADTAQSTALAVSQPSSLLAGNDALGMLSGLKRRNMAQLVKPDAVPVGSMIVAVITDILPSPVATIKGSLLCLHSVTMKPATADSNKQLVLEMGGKKIEIVPTGNVFSFPATGSIRQALVPGIKLTKADKESDEANDKVRGELRKEIGKLIVARRCPNTMNKEYKREQFIFDVFTSEKAVDLSALTV